MIPVRLPAAWVKKIDRLADACGDNRSTALRKVVQIGLDSGQVGLLLRRPGIKGKTVVDRIIRINAAEQRAEATQSALTRNQSSVKAEIAALRAEEELADAVSSEADRRARQRP